MRTIYLDTPSGENLIDITAQVRECVHGSELKDGLCHVFVPHTTAGITMNSGADPATLQDIYSELRRLVPTRTDFRHQFDTPTDAAGHIKSTLVGNSVIFPIQEGDFVSTHHAILFYEFDGPRKRKCIVSFIEAK